MKREDVLAAALEMVNKSRQDDYGPPEYSFKLIARFWTDYLRGIGLLDGNRLCSRDVSAMMILLKVARLTASKEKTDNWVDVAGYAACGGELEDGK